MEKLNANSIKKFLAEKGYNRKDFSISCRQGCYDDYVKVKIKNVDVSKQDVESILKKEYQEIRYDEKSMEILQGCNVFVSVDYDRDALKQKEEEYQEIAQKIIDSVDKKSLSGHQIIKNDDYIWYYYPSNKTIAIFESEKRTSIKHYVCFNAEELAYLMATLQEYLQGSTFIEKQPKEETQTELEKENLEEKEKIVISESFKKSIIREKDKKFHYMITDRLSQDFEYKLNKKFEIEELKETYQSLYYCLKMFSEKNMPEWFTMKDLLSLETKLIKRITAKELAQWRLQVIKELS